MRVLRFMAVAVAGVVAGAVLCACGSTVQGTLEGTGGGSGDGTGGADSSGGSGGSDDPGPPAKLDCTHAQLTQTGQGVATFDTTDADDAQSVSCGAGDAPDILYEWIAPRAGYYTLDTFGSSFDTALAVHEGGEGEEVECGAPDTACSNDAAGTAQSELVRHFEARERILVSVDGSLGARGSGQLNVNAVACPEVDVALEDLPAQLTTAGASDERSGSCGGEGHPERSVRFTPTEDGFYRFQAESNAFVPALYLDAGPRCADAPLQCNPAYAKGFSAQVTRYLRRDEPVSVVVDGKDGSGAFTLSADKVAGTCPSHDDWGQPSSFTAAEQDLLTGSCSPPGDTGPFGSAYHTFPERSYFVHVDYSASTRCTTTITSNEPFAFYRLAGSDCSGAEKSCDLAQPDSGQYSLTYSLTAADNGDYVFVLETHSWSGEATFEVNTMCVA